MSFAIRLLALALLLLLLIAAAAHNQAIAAPAEEGSAPMSRCDCRS